MRFTKYWKLGMCAQIFINIASLDYTEVSLQDMGVWGVLQTRLWPENWSTQPCIHPLVVKFYVYIIYEVCNYTKKFSG